MRIISVTRSEFELEDGKIFPIEPPLDSDMSPEEFQEHYDYAHSKILLYLVFNGFAFIQR